MPSDPHRRKHRSRFLRENRSAIFAGLALILILALVAALFWVMTSSRFVTR